MSLPMTWSLPSQIIHAEVSKWKCHQLTLMLVNDPSHSTTPHSVSWVLDYGTSSQRKYRWSPTKPPSTTTPPSTTPSTTRHDTTTFEKGSYFVAVESDALPVGKSFQLTGHFNRRCGRWGRGTANQILAENKIQRRLPSTSEERGIS